MTLALREANNRLNHGIAVPRSPLERPISRDPIALIDPGGPFFSLRPATESLMTTADLALRSTGVLHGLAAEHFRFHPTHVEVVGDPTLQVCEEMFSGVMRVHEGAQWWIGDILAITEQRHGEKYAQLIDATRYNVQTLMNIASLTSKIPPENRREGLSWSHHRIVASLSHEDQRLLLEQADLNRWTVKALEDVARGYKAQLANPKSTHVGRFADEPATDGAKTDLPSPQTDPDEPEDPEAELADNPEAQALALRNELQSAHREIEQRELEIEALSASDLGMEIRKLSARCAGLDGRIVSLTNELSAERDRNKRQGRTLSRIRSLFVAERDAELIEKAEKMAGLLGVQKGEDPVTALEALLR